jgi:DNA-binding Lrp family transcriptional regulator
LTELAAEGYQAIEMTVDENAAHSLAEQARKKKSLGLFGEEEKIQSMSLMYEPLFKVSYDLQLGKGRFKPLTVYVDSDYGLYRWKGRIQKDELGKLAMMTEKKMNVLRSLEKPLDKKAIQKRTRLTAQAVSRYLHELVEDGILVEEGGRYRFAKGMSMPRLDKPHFAEVDKKITLGKPQTGHMAESEMDEKKIEKFIKLLGDVRIKKVEKILKPSWQAVYDSPSGMRVQKFDAF